MLAITKEKIKKWEEKGKVKKLMRALEVEDRDVRRRAIKALGEIGDAKAAAPLVEAMGHNDLNVQFDSFEALVKIDSQAVDALIKGLSDYNAKIRWSSAKALGKIGNSSAVVPLIKALGDVNEDVRKWAAEALTEIGIPAVDSLINALRDDDENVRKNAAKALTRIKDPKSAAPLIKALEDNNEEVRKYAALAFTMMMDPRAVDPLIRVLRDDNKEIRGYAASALDRIADPKSVDPFIKALEDNNEWVRRKAAEALGKIRDPRAVDPLIKAITDKNEHVRSNAEEALVKIGTPAVDSLIKAMDSQNSSVRRKAVKILDKLRWKPAKDETGLKYHIVKANLEKYIDIGTPPIGSDIKTQGNDSKDILQKTIESSIKILDEKQKSTRKKGAGILDKLGWQPTMDETGAKYYIAKGNIGKCIEIGTAAIDPLIKELEDKNEDVRMETVNTLGKIGDANAAEPLVRALDDKNYGVRVDSVAALVKMGAPAVEPLIKALAEDGKEIHKRAIEALGKIGDTRAVEPLIQALEDEDIDVRKSAVEALKKLYRSGNLSQEKKKVILKLKGQKITEHHDFEISPPDDCYLPSRHSDSPEIYFNL